MYRLLVAILAIAMIMPTLPGCSQKNPGAMNKAEVEAFMKDRLKLSEISLTDKGEGAFSGTGKKNNGSSYSLEVTLDEKGRRIEWKTTDEKGVVGGGFVKHYR
jgi:hypothetical protein